MNTSMTPSVEDLVSVTLSIPKSSIENNISYQSIPEWDSLSHVNLMLAIEKAYDIEISGYMVLELTSVAAIREFIARHTFSRTQREMKSGNGDQIETQKTSGEANQDKSKKVPIHRGLNEVYYDNSRIASIDGQIGKLLYCGYSIKDLAKYSSFEEVTYLLFHGKLPTRTELEAFDAELKAARVIPDQLVEIIHLVQDSHPSDVLRTAISATSAFEPRRYEHTIQDTLQRGIRLIAQIPIILTTHHAISTGREPVEPSKTFSHAANFLYMLRGEIPSEQEVKIIDQDFVLHADHGSNASTFTARVVTGTKADLHAAITAAIAAFSGPLHGGALESAMEMLQEIGQPELAAEYVKKRQEKNLPVYGFGHRVYRTEDPRAYHLREAAKRLSMERGEPKWYNILEAVIDEMRLYARHGINVNVDLHTCVTYHLLGIPRDMFVAIFVISRVAGWVAQVLEQLENNILIRPRLNYVGEAERPYIPIEQR